MYVGHKPPGHLFPEVGMGDALPLALLPVLQEGAPPRIVEDDGAVWAKIEVLLIHHAVVDEREDETIRQTGAQFLHQIQRQRRSPGSIAVEKAHIGIQPDALQRGGAIVRQQAIGEGQQGVYRIQRGAAVALGKGKQGLLPQNKLVKGAKIDARARALQSAQAVH